VVGEIVIPQPEEKVHQQVTYYATGADAGGGPEVKVYNAATNQLKFDFLAYDPQFTGGVRVATGDVNGDGFPDIITAPGPGGGPNVRVFSGKDLSLIANFMAYDPRFRGGVFVAAGDLTDSGNAFIVTGPDAGGGPNVRIFDGSGTLINSYMAFNPRFTGGIHVAAGDVNHDGNSDVVVGAGAGGGPTVAVFSGKTNAVLRSFFAYDPRFTGGVFVATGRFDTRFSSACPKSDIITGPGIGGGADVHVYDGVTGQLLRIIAATPQGFINLSDGQAAISGARVSSVDYNGVRPDDILVAYGAPTTAELNIYNYNTTKRTNSFFAYNPLFSGGIFVGSGHF
jgi:FG-GAP repeat